VCVERNVYVLLKLFLCIYDCSNLLCERQKEKERKERKFYQGRATARLVQRCVWAAIIEHTLAHTRKGVRGGSIIGGREGERVSAGHGKSGEKGEGKRYPLSFFLPPSLTRTLALQL
jgi:hypothetical protein